MKLFERYTGFLIAFYAFTLNAQQTGTITVTDNANVNIINSQNIIGRDEVDVVPDATGEVHLLPQQTVDQVHLSINPALIIPAQYQSSNGSGGSNANARTLNTTIPVGSTSGTYKVNQYGGLGYNIP